MVYLMAKISSLSNNDLTFEINRFNMESIEREIQSRSNIRIPSWGIMSNTGNISCNDNDGSIVEYINKLIDNKEDIKCKIYIVNSFLKNYRELIAEFNADSWEYNNDNNSIIISIKDDLEEWQNINIPELIYDPRKQGVKYPQSFRAIYNYLQDLTPSKFNMLESYDLDDETQKMLDNSFCRYPLLKEGTLWESWEKLCQVCQCYIYKDSKNRTIFKYSRGS